MDQPFFPQIEKSLMVNESSRVREMQMMICKARLVVKKCSQKEDDI